MAPEPIEDALAARLPEAQQIVLLGNQRSFLAALITIADGLKNGSSGSHIDGRVQSALEALNMAMPHYKQIRAFHVVTEPFTLENGMLTANGKLKRDVITARFAGNIEALYQKKSA